MSEGASSLFVEDPALISLAVAIIAIPFITGVILTFLRGFELRKGKDFRYNENLTGAIGAGSLAMSWVLSIIVAVQYFGKYVTLGEHAVIQKVQSETAFLPMKDTAFNWGILLDPLSVIFLVVLTTIATAIHFYATNYMHADEAYTRFFGAMNLFTGSMLGFVLASNLFIAFIYWELLGFTSYLLIGYFWPKAAAAHAGRKAFMYNKVGDVSFIFAMGFIYAKAHTFNFLALADMLKTGSNPEVTMSTMALPALFLFGAAVAKSAQVPLLGWLPEAMEGPTPVSALLHSSTMVKAGLLLIARGFFTFFFVEGHEVIWAKSVSIISGTGAFAEFLTPANIITWVGTFTALAGALLALTATDIKRVLAFSTISQLGYIGLAIGSGGLTAGFYHIISHATFKSLLFLGAGAVIHSVHSQEMPNMGGLKDKMPWTYRTMLVGLLGLMGAPLMSGFWSKDAVLLAVSESPVVVGAGFLYGVAVFTAGITAFYSIKLLILTFFGEPRYDKDHVEPGPTGNRMKWTLIFLGALVVIESIWFTIGTLFDSKGTTGILNFEVALGTMLGVHGGEFNPVFAIPSTVAVILGAGLAYMIYHKKTPFFAALPSATPIESIAKVVRNRFYMDAALYNFSEGPVMWVGEKFKYVDQIVIDEFLIDTVVTEKLAHGGAMVSDWSDIHVVDGTVKWVSDVISRMAGKLRGLQTGLVSYYARYMVLGLVIILSYFALVNYGVIEF